MVQIMEGTYDEVTSILQRMRDMAVQAANGSLSTTEKGYLETEQNNLVTRWTQQLIRLDFLVLIWRLKIQAHL